MVYIELSFKQNTVNTTQSDYPLSYSDNNRKEKNVTQSAKQWRLWQRGLVVVAQQDLGAGGGMKQAQGASLSSVSFGLPVWETKKLVFLDPLPPWKCHTPRSSLSLQEGEEFGTPLWLPAEFCCPAPCACWLSITDMVQNWCCPFSTTAVVSILRALVSLSHKYEKHY